MALNSREEPRCSKGVKLILKVRKILSGGKVSSFSCCVLSAHFFIFKFSVIISGMYMSRHNKLYYFFNEKVSGKQRMIPTPPTSGVAILDSPPLFVHLFHALSIFYLLGGPTLPGSLLGLGMWWVTCQETAFMSVQSGGGGVQSSQCHQSDGGDNTGCCGHPEQNSESSQGWAHQGC